MKNHKINISYEDDDTNFLENSQTGLEDTNETPI